MNLRLHRLAVAEIDHEVDYCETQQPGLGAALEDEIDGVLSFIVRFRRRRPSGEMEELIAALDDDLRGDAEEAALGTRAR